MSFTKEEIKIEEQKIYDQLRAAKCVIALEGLSDDALDGGWSYTGVNTYINILEDELNDLKESHAETQLRLEAYLASFQINRSLYEQIEAQVRVIAKLEKQNEMALDALCTLTFLAETSGGTAGKDEKMCKAIERARSVLFTNIGELDE